VGLVCAAAVAQSDNAAEKSSPSATTSSTSHPTTKHHGTSSTHKGKHSKKTSSRRGQQKIDSERARQIQQALIREHYMSGEPTGKWDAGTEDALRRFQADNGWQNKTVPDSRALIKLGLGPSNDHLLNPESAMTTTPDAARANATPSRTSAGAESNQPQR
jgi:peptidoglycan hydrolase-like protein with peptidoglycan-binding domain